MENNENPMIDERIIRLNEIISTKLSSVSKSKREGIKHAKVAANHILKTWNGESENGGLEVLINDKLFKEVQYELWCIAKSRLDQLTYSTKEAVKTEEQTAINEVAENNDETTSETTAATDETPKTDKTTVEGKTTRSKHVVGEIHPNGKWIWTEYKPGKFDWKSLNGWKWGKKSQKGDSNNLNLNKPKSAKKTVKSEKSVKVRTIEEILATKPTGMSDPQERVFKLLRKGYRIDPNAATPQGYTLIKDDNTIVIIEGVMNALLNRMKVTFDEINQFKA